MCRRHHPKCSVAVVTYNLIRFADCLPRPKVVNGVVSSVLCSVFLPAVRLLA